MIKMKAEQDVNNDNQEQKEPRILILTQSPNQKCAKIVELMDKDNTTGPFQKTLVLGVAGKSKDPIKRYVLKLSTQDAQDTIDKVKNLL